MDRSDFHPSSGAKAQSRRLIVDVSVINKNDAGTGIQRVVRNVWAELRSCSSDWEIIPVFARANGKFYQADPNFLTQQRVGDADIRSAFNARPNDVFLGLDFSPVLLVRARHTITRWKQLGIPIHLVVYDLLPITNPAWFTQMGARNYRNWLTFLECYADQVLCISKSVADDLRAVVETRRWWRFWRKSRAIDVDVIRLGTDFLVRGGAVQPQQLVCVSDRPIILMVGTIEPRKGYEFALRVFDQLWTGQTPEPVFVIVGKAGWKTRSLQARLAKHPRAGTSLFWLKHVDDEGLAWLYANSRAFFSTSYAEGFGLPLVEAMSHRLQVIATDLRVFREFGSEGLALFEQGDVDQAAQLLNSALQSHIPTHGMAKTAHVSWTDTAADIFQKISH